MVQILQAHPVGDLTAMSLLTVAMDQGAVVYVSIILVIRITLAIAISPIIFNLIGIRRHILHAKRGRP